MKNTLSVILEAAAARSLGSLLIGGNAVILFGFPRSTIDIDLLVPASKRSHWLDLMLAQHFWLYHATDAFAQFEPEGQDMVPVDLMFVDDATWMNLSAGGVMREVYGQRVLLPQPEHLIALKLHAAASPARGRSEADWEDIRQLIEVCAIDPSDPTFRELVLRHGGEAAARRVESFQK